MSIPKHKDPSYQDRVAIAPYNFVPLPEAILTAPEPPPQDVFDGSLLSGKFTCTLTTASPLYIRAARRLAEYLKKDGEQPSAPYYQENEKDLRIPGSSLRGMLRTLVEVVAHARLSPVVDKPLFFRTVDSTSIGDAYGARMVGGDRGAEGAITLAKAGYMEVRNGDYYIRPALEINGVQHYRLEEDIALEVIPNLNTMSLSYEETNRRGETETKYRFNSRKNNPDTPYEMLRCPVWFRPTGPKTHIDSACYYAEVTEVVVSDQKPSGTGWERGWFVGTGWVPSKPKHRGKHRHWIVGPPDPDDTHLIPVSDDDIDLYLESGIPRDMKKMSVLPHPGDGGPKPIPCFYTFWEDQEGGLHVAFGHTGMFRLPYQKTPADMLPSSLKADESKYDLAEAMFGYVDAKQKGARKPVAGRVFVTDAKFTGKPDEALLPEVVLSDQALSSPKPTTFQHYLTQSNPDDKDHLSHYDDPNTKTTLRGHKFYWHVGEDVTARLNQAIPIDPRRPQNAVNKFKPVKPNQKFVFEIHFENLRPEELGALLWVLEKAKDPKYRLKLGMGKPYGFGSIAISHEVEITDRKKRYKSLMDGDAWQLGAENESNKTLENARVSFTRFVLSDARVNPAHAACIEDLPRIQELLALLSWDEKPDPERLTRYMELKEFTSEKHIFTNQRGKFSRRPVLPNPTTVARHHSWFPGLKEHAPKGTPARTRKQPKPTDLEITGQPRSRFHPKPAPRKTPIEPPPEPYVRPPKPVVVRPTPVDKRASELKVGDCIQAFTGKQVPPKRGDLELRPDFDKKRSYNVYVLVLEEDRKGYEFRKERPVLLTILAIEGNDQAGYEILCTPAED